MKTRCPCCGAENSLDALVNHDAARQTVWDSNKWPSVKQFLNALPPRPLPPLLGKAKMTPQQLDEGRRNIQKILNNLEMKRIPPAHDGQAALEQAIKTMKEQSV